MNDEQYFLANAYLDGELTADERRIAEADPAVMTEVEQLRALQAELRDVPAPTTAARESAIGAAMATFESAAAAGTGETPAGDAPGHTGAPVVPFRPRPAYARYLTIAAAFVAVAGLGIIVAQGGGGGDDDSADTASVVSDDDADAPTAAVTESVGTADAAETEIMAADEGDAGMAGDEMATQEESAAEPTAADVASEDSADSTGDNTAEGTGGAPEGDGAHRAVPPDFDPEAPITSDVELGTLGAYLIVERDAGRLPPTPNHPCGDAQQILDETTLVLDDEQIPVYVDVDEADGRVTALSTDTCAELLIGSLHPD